MAAVIDYDAMGRNIVNASEKLNYPGSNKLYSHLKANSKYVPWDIVQAFTDRQPERQIFAQPRRVRHPPTGRTRHRSPPKSERGSRDGARHQRPVDG